MSHGFWLLSAGYAAIPWALSVVHVALGERPGRIMWAMQGFAFTMAVIFFVFGCVAEVTS